MRDVVLCVNSGSSSLKVALFEVDGEGELRIAEESVEHVRDAAHALAEIRERLAPYPEPTMAGHRVVHGGERVSPARVDDALLAELEGYVPLAPLHLPAAIAGMRAVRGIPQVACFDTAFHATMPDVARRFAVRAPPNVRRYGFHGLSYEYVVSTLSPLPSKLIVAHLGSGASLAAIRDGKSIDTTMGMSPTGGIPMATRSGDLDPGVLLWLAREHGVEELERLVDRDAGLTAIAGTGDMRTILERRRGGDARADLAFRVFTYAVRKAIGALAVALEGLDLLVFTGGIGEHAEEVRTEIARGVAFLGAPARVVATDEDRMVARHTFAVLRRT